GFGVSRAEVAQPGRAPPCQGGCRGFKSRLPLHATGPVLRDRPRAFPAAEVTLTRQPPASDRKAVARAVEDLIRALGLDEKAEPELNDTPERVADLYADVFSGLDPKAVPELATFPHETGASHGDDHLVAVRDLEFHSLCVHHFVPFFGRAHV